MNFTPSTEVDLVSKSAPAPRRRGVRSLAAAVLSLGLATTFAVPAYANSGEDGQDPVAFAVRTGGLTQNFVAAEADVALPNVALELAEIEAPEPLEETTPANERDAQAAAGNGGEVAAAKSKAPAVAAGSGSGAALLAAAYAQIGINQDCTDMVQNALAALGYTTRRDQGGYDHGVQDFARYGTPVALSDAQPGDIMISGGHVSIYAGNGTAVHGGWNGFQTAEFTGGPSMPSFYHTIVRLP
ncbi:NlpC/P60 family protein [Canibacter zhoujuaniae]|uniref:NlpC/P60 family protein n=1 Tax=Canibacter zhoujuaniae TaxID=2708343 RepID=UPI0014203A00|nr:NlpC/P60 family protein [Canibacter zhoujuaniae]